MIIDKDSLKLDGINLGQYITQAKFGYHKLWGKDSGRNLAGTHSGTLLGIFPKITCNFGKLSQEDLETLAPKLDSATQQLTYYDPVKKANTTIETYSGDWELINEDILINKPFTISFIAKRKRS